MLRKTIPVVLLYLLIAPNLFAQQKDDKGIYLMAEKMPAIKGGMAAIGKKVQYPRIAKEMGIQGVVYVGFIVDSEGKVIEPKILKSLAKPLDEEALRVITKEVKFTPGYHQGKAVPVRMVLPIRFRI
ncbi:MAG: energy transducer TonB [Candidatus Marinimicrobia bacterium]|jgi:TonB family protein|nr:energy transducer TonB [Candidatus Neomarinimicrobiota bacterium]MDP6725952.1 energy transducer TonB [Candidatus Neomarinimicrobiota bacterium]|tara:strand:+ start:11681 stop:12061 length:381 start_codon:yes stop_codon:yes gene_type:complete